MCADRPKRRPSSGTNWNIIICMSEVSEKVEARVEQARKYIDKQKGWRPQRRTVVWLVSMAVVLVVAVLVVPRVLPGKIPDGDALLGGGRGISVVPLGAGAVRDLVPAPRKGEAFTAWAVSEGREEVVIGWSRERGGKVEEVKVQMRSAYSGRTLAQWAVEFDPADPALPQVGFVPQHNLIWFLTSGRLGMIDIKSAEILPFQFKSPEGKKEIEPAEGATSAGFSPDGLLAFAERERGLVVVRGLSTSRIREPLVSQVVLEPGRSTDEDGDIITGRIESFIWLDDDSIAVVVSANAEVGAPASVYLVDAGKKGARRASLLVPAPSAGWISSISLAPESGGFAVIYSRAGKTSLRRYDPKGKRVGVMNLPKGDWRGPLSWTSQ